MRLSHILASLFLSVVSVQCQQATLGLADGFLSFNSSTFAMQLVKDSQTLYSLKTINGEFDFIPADQMTLRQYNGNYHLGDITFRARLAGSSSWSSGDSSAARKPVKALSATGSTFATSDLSPTLPANSLLKITRRWVLSNGTLELLFDVTNSQSSSVEIGALGAPLEFNNVCYPDNFSQAYRTHRHMFRYLPTGRPPRRTSFAVSLILTLARTRDMSKLRHF